MDQSSTVLEMRFLQDEIFCLNGAGIDMIADGKLKKASENFQNALARLKVISKMKKHFSFLPSASEQDLNSSWPSMKASFVRKACEPVPIDTMSSVLSMHWETIASVAIIYNASLVHYRCRNFTQCKLLLDLARGLLKKKLNEDDIQVFMEENFYASSVVILIYMTYGRVILQLPKPNKVHAGQAFKMAALLVAQLNNSYQRQRIHFNEHDATQKEGTSKAIKSNQSYPTESEMDTYAYPPDDHQAGAFSNQIVLQDVWNFRNDHSACVPSS